MTRRDGDVHPDKASDLPAELQAELVHGALTDHYRKTLDEPIPALMDLSPRAAAQTAAGRRKVADWLKHIENQSKCGRPPDDLMASYDFTWLWRDLGLEKLRRINPVLGQRSPAVTIGCVKTALGTDDPGGA